MRWSYFLLLKTTLVVGVWRTDLQGNSESTALKGTTPWSISCDSAYPPGMSFLFASRSDPLVVRDQLMFLLTSDLFYSQFGPLQGMIFSKSLLLIRLQH